MPEANEGAEQGVAAVPTAIKLAQIEEMFRMCGLRPLSADIRNHLSGEQQLSDEDVEKIIQAGERFAKASRSVGLKELDYLDEPAKYIEGAEPEGDSSGGQPESQTVEIEVTEEGSGETSGGEGGGESGGEQEQDAENGPSESGEEDQ